MTLELAIVDTAPTLRRRNVRRKRRRGEEVEGEGHMMKAELWSRRGTEMEGMSRSKSNGVKVARWLVKSTPNLRGKSLSDWLRGKNDIDQ